jgi:hypothetical protein
MEDLFVSFRGTKSKPLVETSEILRILGPFPNVRNTLSGTWTRSLDSSLESNTLDMTYNTMIDGNGGVITAKDGSTSRFVRIANSLLLPGAQGLDSNSTLVLLPSDPSGSTLVFKREDDLEGAFKALRVDRPDNWKEPKEGGGLKFPWDKSP